MTWERITAGGYAGIPKRTVYWGKNIVEGRLRLVVDRDSDDRSLWIWKIYARRQRESSWTVIARSGRNFKSVPAARRAAEEEVYLGDLAKDWEKRLRDVLFDRDLYLKLNPPIGSNDAE